MNNKNDLIKQSYHATLTRRENQVTRVIFLKVNYRRLTQAQRDALNLAFASAKHLYNDVIKSKNIWSYTPPNSVEVTLPDGTKESRALNLGSQVKQAIITKAQSNIRALSALKKNGHKIGALRPVKIINSIPLKQKNVTFKLNERGNKVKIQKIPGKLRLLGYDRLKEWDEYGPAELLRLPDGYYLALTVFMDKEKYEAKKSVQAASHNVKQKGPRGHDAGSRVFLTNEDGSEFNEAYPTHTKKAKHWARKMSKLYDPDAKDQSKGYRKAQREYRKEVQRAAREKDAKAKEYVYYELLAHNEIFIQDEQFATWKKRKDNSFFNMGKRMDKNIVPRIYALLKQHPGKVHVLDKWQPTTQWCPRCGRRTPCSLSERVFLFEYCGYSAPRDAHGAQNMIRLGRCPLSYAELRKPRDVPIGPFIVCQDLVTSC